MNRKSSNIDEGMGEQLSTFVQICKLFKQQNCISVANGLVTSFFFFFFFFFFLIILFIFLIQDSLQADLEFKLQSIASYRKTDYKSIWKKNKNKNKRNYRL